MAIAHVLSKPQRATQKVNGKKRENLSHVDRLNFYGLHNNRLNEQKIKYNYNKNENARKRLTNLNRYNI